jgi:hypothetical protein
VTGPVRSLAVLLWLVLRTIGGRRRAILGDNGVPVLDARRLRRAVAP